MPSDTKTTAPRRVAAIAAVVLFGLAVTLLIRGCHSDPRLVEQFDNGPVGGPRGESEGYRWVGQHDEPTAGKTWKPVDPDTLTPDQRKRIRNSNR